MHIGPPGRAGPENGFPGATNSTWYAQSFTVSVTSPLVMVQANVEKYCLPGAVTGTLLPCPGGQHPGDLVIQVRGNSAPQGVPGALLVNRTIPETAIPWGRVWVNATGWDLNLTAGSTYWVVLSTVNGTTGGYYPWKEESAYQHLILRSSDGGLTWGRPREPADVFIDLRTVAQSFSVEPEVEITVKIGNTSWVSQSVEVGHPTNVSTVLVFLSRGVQDNEGTIFADVRADDGYGNPSQMVLATGSFTPSDGPVSWKGIWAVNLDYPITLLPGVKYWLVFRSVDTPSGKSHYPDMALQAFAFYNDSASYGGSSLGAYESGNAGSTWNRIDGLHTDLIFGLAYSPLSAAKPSINQLRGEIESRQMLSVSGGHLASAWQMFLASSTSRIESDLVRWLNRGGYAYYIPSGNTSLTVPQRTWIGFDTNSPSLFEAVAPSRYGFDLYPVVSLASKAQYVIPPGQVPNSIPVVVLQPRGSMSTTTAANYLTVMSSLNRSVVFVDASPVELFGRLDSISGAIDQLSRMRSQGLSWPELGSSPGPWLTWYSPTNWTATGGLPSLRGKPLALLDVASMQLVWRGTAGTYSPAGGSQSTYLLRTLGDLDLDYSNVAASSETVYPNQALLVFAAPRGEEVWAVINSTREVESVTVNDSALPKVASYASLVAGRYDSQGWSSLPDGLLLVRFPSSGNDTVRVSISPPPQPNQLILGLSLAAPFLVLASAVVADLAVWLLYLRRRTRPGAKDAYTRPD
jgi:hypothetical protein